MQNKNTYFLFLLVCFTNILYSQEVVSSQGETLNDGIIDFSFTIGEPLISTFSNQTTTTSQGFHQTTDTYYPLPNECIDPNISLNQNNEPSGNYSAEVAVVSSSLISTNSSINYIAGETIILKPGFHAPFNSEFLGIIIGCTPTQSPLIPATSATFRQLKPTTKSLINAFQISPNPARDLVELTFEIIESSSTKIYLFNATGVQVNYWDLGVLDKGQHFKKLTNLSLSEGMYYLSLVSNQSTISTPLIILKQ